jgi:hypothetical protein
MALTGAAAAPAESPVSAVTWSAIIAGAFAMAAIALILLALGAGLGFASISPWSGSGPSATTFKVATGIWLIVVQWLSAAFGGYLTGRLRTKWVSVPADEIYFRDTAHGFLAWALAAVVTVAALASASSAVVGGAARMAGAAAGTAAQGAAGAVDPTGYLVDSLFRTDHPAASADPQAVRAETVRIIAQGVSEGGVSTADRTFLAQLVAARTGLSQPEAERRVDQVVAKAKATADKVRKTASDLSFFTAFSMLVGAFIAAVAAVVAGHRRDHLLALRGRTLTA